MVGQCWFFARAGMGIFRHADAGYELAQNAARERGAKIPNMS